MPLQVPQRGEIMAMPFVLPETQAMALTRQGGGEAEGRSRILYGYIIVREWQSRACTVRFDCDGGHTLTSHVRWSHMRWHRRHQRWEYTSQEIDLDEEVGPGEQEEEPETDGAAPQEEAA